MIAHFKANSYRLSVISAALITLLACFALTDAKGQNESADKNPRQLAQEFVGLLVEGKFDEAVKNFDSTMKTALSADKLKETWNSVINQAGAFQKQLGVRSEEFLDTDIIFVTCQFEKGPLDIKTVYNNKWNKQT